MYEFTVKEGDMVKTGDPIGISGGCPGELKDQEVSTGCHVHIELRKGGTVIPYPEYKYSNHGEDLAKYKKYKEHLQDYGARLQAFLDEYPLKSDEAKPFRNAEDWRKVGKDSGIHSALLVCIGMADTGLGNSMKTPFNVGNVGNTATKSNHNITSPQEGMEAIADALNGTYLGGHQTVGELSIGGGGSESGKIYAGSPDNWNNNVLWCLQQILGDPSIKEDWKFRL